MDRNETYQILGLLQANYPDSFRGMSKEAANVTARQLAANLRRRYIILCLFLCLFLFLCLGIVGIFFMRRHVWYAIVCLGIIGIFFAPSFVCVVGLLFALVGILGIISIDLSAENREDEPLIATKVLDFARLAVF